MVEPVRQAAPDDHKHRAQSDLGGGKDIGFFGGITLLTNSITGPGLVTIPLLFQQAGWVSPLLCMIIIAGISCLAAIMLCSAMEKVPGNERFKGRVEFSAVAKEFLPIWAYRVTIFLLILSLLAVFISSVVVSAQTVDIAIIAVFKKTFALELWPSFGFTYATMSPGAGNSPFGSDYVISLGFIIVLIITIPMGLFNLEDNIIVQKGAFVLLLVIFAEWFVACFTLGLDVSRVPAFLNDQTNVLGSIIFNYAFITTVPSWCNERRPDVPIKKSIWISVATATVFYAAIGFVGGFAFTFGDNQDLLIVIDENTRGRSILHPLSQVCVYLFPIIAFQSSIPVFSIIIKYNLIQNEICTKHTATWWAVIFPWVISIGFYAGAGVIEVINWTSLCINGIINFVIPMLLYIISRKRKRINRIITKRRRHDSLTLYSDDERDAESSDDELLKDDYIADDYKFKVMPNSRFLRPTCIAITSIVVVTILSVAVIVINVVETIKLPH
ncbi:hypothetical protein PROFUN_12265 [Planoprotostelium fungivorum]|uniref:Amino acid transporter transmembrane domain-containing protein n=1 Tax=Planoprotostelium fungivorum TaxID=1890364 RepID=A0A2P6N843_9EUKA|nr:hypothetical protein PROFUN_12265 [Planoprotostelium fungivorum]